MVVVIMAFPTRKIEINGMTFILGSTDQLIHFDDGGYSVPASAYKTLESGAVDYQVPVGKKLLLIGAAAFYKNGTTITELEIGKSTAADLGTGYGFKAYANNSGTTGAKLLNISYVAGDYVTMKSNWGGGAFTLTCTTLIGIESDA